MQVERVCSLYLCQLDSFTHIFHPVCEEFYISLFCLLFCLNCDRIKCRNALLFWVGSHNQMPYIEWLRKNQCKWLWKVEVHNETRSRQQNHLHFPAPFFSFSGKFLWWYLNIIVSLFPIMYEGDKERERDRQRDRMRDHVSYLTNW